MPEAWLSGAAAGYALGSIPVGLWVGLLVRGVDLRRGGSGKTGTTNVLRTLGLRWSLLVFVLDLGKGVAAVAIVRAAFDSPTGEVVAGLGAIMGHIFPALAGFRGGRAAATGFGALLLLTPTAAVVGMATGLGLMGLTRIMSLSVLLGLSVAAAAQGLHAAFGAEPEAYAGFAVGAWAIITAAHRDNLGRLARGGERMLSFRAQSARQPAAVGD